jgi:hypothetical protein
MPVTLKELESLRAQLVSDRKLCGNGQTAQQLLDVAERHLVDVEASWAKRNPVEALDHILSEIETNQIGSDSATSEEITEIAKDIREWETALQTVPAENRDLPLFKIAEKAVSILKQNCVALADKTDLEFRMIAVFESVKHLRAELNEVERLRRENSELNLGAVAKVFQYFRDSLTPALDSVLNKSLGDILSASQSRH